MSDRIDTWGRINAEWAAPVITALATLDEADAVPGFKRHDGTYMGHDLVEIANLYSEKYSSHEPGVLRIFESAIALNDYVDAVGSQAARRLGAVIMDAIFAGACALLESRVPDFDAEVSGFGPKFIEEEFEYVFNEQIMNGKALDYGRSWSTMWGSLLDGCHTDLFVNREGCPFQ